MEFRIATSWPYGILNVRARPDPGAPTVRTVSDGGDGALQRARFAVDGAGSTEAWWRLAGGGGGWVTKLYDGHVTLVPVAAAEGGGAAAPPPGPAAGEDGAMGDLGGARRALERARASGGALLVLTGAGMSVCSGVPVFRGADGSMSADFLRFLGAYNAARRAARLPEADDWFSFSVPEMFRPETAREAWAYWRWRTLRALVAPGADYGELARLTRWFGAGGGADAAGRVFVQTSNCDMLHAHAGPAGLAADSVFEIHGSLSRVQCSGCRAGSGEGAGQPCTQQMWPVDAPFLARLEAEPDWVPMCPACGECCLRPNVMIFGDGSLVESAIGAQQRRMEAFTARFGGRWVVLEVGAGVVVPSIRCYAEELGGRGDGGLIHVNPSRSECEQMQRPSSCSVASKYFPLVARSTDALKAICDGLRLPPSPLGDAGALCDVVGAGDGGGAQAAGPPPPSAASAAGVTRTSTSS